MDKKKKKANIINENEPTKNCYDNEMFRPTIDDDILLTSNQKKKSSNKS